MGVTLANQVMTIELVFMRHVVMAGEGWQSYGYYYREGRWQEQPIIMVLPPSWI